MSQNSDAYSRLSPKQKSYVDRLLSNGGNKSEAARYAGYAGGNATTPMKSMLVRSAIEQREHEISLEDRQKEIARTLTREYIATQLDMVGQKFLGSGKVNVDRLLGAIRAYKEAAIVLGYPKMPPQIGGIGVKENEDGTAEPTKELDYDKLSDEQLDRIMRWEKDNT